jgi:septum formation protein
VADAAPATPLLLASRSPQRRAILEQLGIPFDVVEPRYEEAPPPELADAVEVVGEHAQGKARSVADQAGDRPVLGVDTEVVLQGLIFGKPADATEAEQMLEELSGKTHVVMSGLCLVTPGWEVVGHEGTRVSVRTLTPATSPRTSKPGSGRDARAPTRSRAAAPRSCAASRATT